MGNPIYKALSTASLVVSLMAISSTANATCTKPVGTYVGSGSGVAGANQSSWTATEAGNIALSIKVLSDGTVNATEKGKLLSRGTYQTTWSVTPANNVFSTTTCQGHIYTSSGARFTYTSGQSGSVNTFIYMTNDNNIVLYNIRLERV